MSAMDPTPKRNNRPRTRYEDDPGFDRFYDGAVTRHTIAEGTKTTMKTYHSALMSRTPQMLPYDTGFTPGPIYHPKTTLLSGRTHGLLSESLGVTKPLASIHVRQPGRPSPDFYKGLERFETYAHPGKRPTKITARDYFSTSHRDGNTYRFGSTYR
ncbi:hypothetical protein KFE25_002112 [Diacronema lutheri]|uniref:Uncharacterized protein n=1 Tax=Diacronema lutheri TaxID=2081491 RepID=A0A8J6CCQ3_DIALT|nr:hypothetical protein KFE25_002112 [Diacronema lutheri]